MEFLVEFEMKVPDGTAESELTERERAETTAAAKLTADGHLLRVWRRAVPTGSAKVLGLYRADSETQLDDLLSGLPLYPWMNVAVTPLEPHPNDPATERRVGRRQKPANSKRMLEPELTFVYRLEATLGEPLDLGETPQGRRRIVPQTGGTFAGPQLSGKLLPGVSADWQIVRPDGTALADIRSTLQTDDGALLYVRSRGVRHGSPDVLARLGRGENVDPSEYTFRTATQMETAAPELDWLNKGVFISVGGRQPAGVTYETYLVS
ncbi:MAG TPA: muconolactone Delta-isomerase family protein [Acidimicrobiales bacterium]|nr:muconolactone Delta-isomerase family protein [Acidimicrobiales bacterium]